MHVFWDTEYVELPAAHGGQVRGTLLRNMCVYRHQIKQVAPATVEHVREAIT